MIAASVRGEMFRARYADVFTGDERWRALRHARGRPLRVGAGLDVRPAAAVLRRDAAASREPVGDIEGARCLVMVGDSVTTDHISPAGAIKPDSPAGRYLHRARRRAQRLQLVRLAARQPRGDGARHVRERAAAEPARPGLARGRGRCTCPTGEETTIFEASERYLAEGVPLIVLAGKEYGSGSSRDWAAKGPNLLGVRAVIAESYERIHRSNLLMMGILPLQFAAGESAESLGLTGRETFSVAGLDNGEAREVTVRADDKEFRAPRPPRHAARARVPPPRRHPPVRAAAPRGARRCRRPRRRPFSTRYGLERDGALTVDAPLHRARRWACSGLPCHLSAAWRLAILGTAEGDDAAAGRDRTAPQLRRREPAPAALRGRRAARVRHGLRATALDSAWRTDISGTPRLERPPRSVDMLLASGRARRRRTRPASVVECFPTAPGDAPGSSRPGEGAATARSDESHGACATVLPPAGALTDDHDELQGVVASLAAAAAPRRAARPPPAAFTRTRTTGSACEE